MNKKEILNRELRSLGQYYRHDWSHFDGRCLKREIDEIMDWFMDENNKDDFVKFSRLLEE